jgi:hypothetical protein
MSRLYTTGFVRDLHPGPRWRRRRSAQVIRRSRRARHVATLLPRLDPQQSDILRGNDQPAFHLGQSVFRIDADRVIGSAVIL